MATATKKRKRAASETTVAVMPMPDKSQIKRAAQLIKHVADPTRLTILLFLSREERHVGAICELANQSQPGTSHHLALLRAAQLIEPRRVGKQNIYSLTETGRTLVETARGLFRGEPAGANGREAKENSPNGQ